MPLYARVFVFLVLLGPGRLAAQRISYFVSFPNLAHHEAQIDLIVSDVSTRNAVFRMSRSSPGRYATHEFGKNVYDVTATDQEGKALLINRADGDVYEVPHAGGYVHLKYTLFGNYSDGTYAGIDPGGVHLNIPAAFMWMKGAENVPITIHFNLPEDKHWTIATQLQPTNDPATFIARGLQYFMDCPVLIGSLSYRNWMVKNPDGKTYHFRIALDGTADSADLNVFSEKVQRIVRQEQAVYGEVPAYDDGTYTFLASINPYVHGDGMEHRNSTMIAIPGTFHGEDRMLGVFAHEFFHCWNVKRIRPRSLEPFNFEKSNMSRELWFAEGFTQYYGSLILLRSGIGKDSDYVRRTLGQLIEARSGTPGGRLYSPVQSSEMAVFTDAGVAVDKTNFPNIFTSYYSLGGAVALALDLQLRTNYQKSLDQLMQAAWKKFGKPEIPYTLQGLQDVLAALTGDRKFAQDFFDRFIYGHDPIDYNALLAPAGFTVKKADPGKAWIGISAFSEREGLLIERNTLRGTPLYESGLDLDDKIIAIDNQDVRTNADLTSVLDRLHPGTAVNIRYIHRNEEHTARITPEENPNPVVGTYEAEGRVITPAIAQFRQSWLGPK